MDKLVIIPTYNEKENIENILRKVFSLEGRFHVLVVDDGSPDGTATIVKQLQQEFGEQLHIAERGGKQGLGTAYIFGFKWALQKGYRYIFEMDADFSHNPDDLLRLYDACHTKADVAVGSRYVSGGKIRNWPFDRVFISYGASVYVRLITWMPVKDCTAGFVCYKREVLEKIPLDKVRFIGYAFQIEMKYRAWKLGFKIKEVPITFVDRKEGVSKMSKGIVKEAIFGVWKMRRFIKGKSDL
ncbi:polyprenol monophosphomannose synthase [Taibaiella koreensis]|uniref:polyprenol monophosphomannose synthase n=1 Tax=Taibaiella koreensis TaxID=1268548 RepID=UPI000E59DDE6|nr:polyprenol monophosphomannose synthase [Taibaiella koreensis]